MTVRIPRLLCTVLIGACVTTAAWAASTTTLVWRGDDVTERGVVRGMAEAWQSSGHGHIELQPFNTASGLDAVASGTADLAGTARGSSGNAIDAGLTFTPVAWDGLVLITSPSNPVSNLTLKQVHDIYYGKITNWKDVGGADAPINVYAVASPGDGVEFSLRKLLFGRGGQPVAAPRLYVNTIQLEQAVTLDPRAFGVTTLASVAGMSKLKMLHVDDSAPSTASIASGSYPLFMELYLVTKPTNPNAAAAQEFVDFTKSAKGSAVLREHHLLPFADGAALVAMDSSRRARILAEVGAHASSEGSMMAGPTAAPAAASAAAVAAVSSRTPVAATPGLSAVTGGVIAAPGISSIKGVHGEAFTVAAASSHGADFTKVTADTFVTFAKVSSKKAVAAAPAAPIKAATHVAAEPKALSKSESKTASAKASKSAAKSEAQTYRVGPGETLYSIARKHGVDVAQIRTWNHLKDNTVRQGQVLRVSAR